MTGGAGFIGSHLVDRLIKEKCHVTVIDDLSTGTRANLTERTRSKHLRFLHSSILDTAQLNQAMKGIERVFHEAAIVSPEYATQNPIQTANVNVQGTLNLLEAARQLDLEHLTYASSAAVYGSYETMPITEQAPTTPLSPYGASKLSGEHFVKAYHETYGLKTTTLRYFNVYGPRQVQNPYSGVITIFLQRLHAGRALEVQGDGEQTRDFIYVSEVAEANLLAASSTEAAGQVFNIATGIPTSINQLIDMLRSILGLRVAKKRISARPGDIRYSFGDPRKAKEILGFKPKITFRDGLERYISWLKLTRSI